MVNERREDYIGLAHLLEGNVANATDINHMKKTLDAHTETIGEIKESMHEATSGIKGLNSTLREFLTNYKSDKEELIRRDIEHEKELDRLNLKVKWIVRSILAFFATVGTILTIFSKKVALAIATLL